MRPALTIREFLSQYQHKLKPSFCSRKTGLERENKLPRLASDTFDAAYYFNIQRQNQAITRDGITAQ